MPTSLAPISWTVLVPLKSLARAKSRLLVPAPQRRALAAAMAADTVAACRRTPRVQRVVLVCESESDAATVAALSSEPFDVLVAPGLEHNHALVHAEQKLRSLSTAQVGMATLPGDLPFLQPAELAPLLSWAALHPRSHVPDRAGRGTTLLTATPGSGLAPAYGQGSARKHHGSGAVRLWARPTSGARWDVDVLDSLRDPRARDALGEATAQACREIPGLGVVGADRPSRGTAARPGRGRTNLVGMSAHGLLLAAGAGRRMGMPKALVDDWLPRSIRAMQQGGCAEVLVVLGAGAAEARSRIDGLACVDVMEAKDWSEGMGASLRAGLRRIGRSTHELALVSLVDLPDVDERVVGRLLDSAFGDGEVQRSLSPRRLLARAAYHGEPGHPVMIGRAHWSGVIDSAWGDRGARDYLAARQVRLIECGDLATGRDVDRR
ncbi:2-phospho-L-lactate guanylyltransferase [Nocardioides sp. AE5]|uniref:2-phospho-L-lactate guanylyltransferase n=1 Tax=Nocardioides sp. AE5 TaxID=2962573 RepID=UPI002881EF29|nr:2-phospho-L-lactate guanylyltransferase [Nocardioides sp. AE5]MDT0202492.1 2-phospho-L-lactate guanylyltransferase [Nocardioides sp. AE5]